MTFEQLLSKYNSHVFSNRNITIAVFVNVVKKRKLLILICYNLL